MSITVPEADVDEAYRERLQGEIFTRRWVVDLILDLAGYTADRDLATLRAVEPACGEGAFLGPMVERIGQSCRAWGRPIVEARDALSASDLLADNVTAARSAVNTVLRDEGWPTGEIDGLPEMWVTSQDYLLSQPTTLQLFSAAEHRPADFVIGNPPYIRPEDVPPSLYQAYRKAFPTMCGRADVYVAFIEAALRSLAPGGVIAFVCADRWMRNQYGRELRSLIGNDFAVEAVISLHDVDAFEEQVSAYPAITTIRNRSQGPALVVDTNSGFTAKDVQPLLRWASSRSTSMTRDNFQGTRLPHWFKGGDSWPGGNPIMVRMVEELNDRMPLIEDTSTGTRVGIGVATGNDSVFITDNPDLVETDRLLPLAMASDGASGTLTWSGQYLVSPWEDDGSLAKLECYPRLRSYFEAHQMQLSDRHVAKKATRQWYRTIDKVNAHLTPRPKLLFPDMKMVTHPIFDAGASIPITTYTSSSPTNGIWRYWADS